MRFLMLTRTVGLLSGGWDLGWHQYTTSSHATTLESNKSVVRKAISHWSNLDSGHRLRRATRRYAQALAESEPAYAFQTAYVGLEVLEKPLAHELGISPGVEERVGRCKSCNATYTYRKSTLAAVKRYVTGAAHPEGSTEEGEKEWTECSEVRNNLAHGLRDLAEIER